MSSMNNVKKRIIISMFAITLLILTLFGITYAYFTAKIKENDKSESIKISAARLELSYNGEGSYVKISNLQPGGKIEKKTFSITNEGTKKVDNYDIILENLVNELNNYEDLTYTLTCKSSDDNDCSGSNGIFPKTNQVIATNTIESNVTHSYILTLNYKETGTNQSIDMNKEISAKVNIKHDISSVKTLKIYGNSIQDGTPDINNPAEIKSLGNLITDEKDANYNKFQIPIKVSGKNLFNKEAVKDDSNWSSGNYTYARFLPFVFKKGVHYIISMKDNLCWKDRYPYNTDTQVALVVNSENKWGGKVIGNSTVTYQTPTTIDIYNETEDTYLVLYYSSTINTPITREKIFETLFPNFQIEVGEIVTNYESYKEKIYNVYLDEPLRKVGNVSDYLDLENRIVVRNVGEKIFDGTENILSYENGVYYGLLHNNNVVGISNYFSNNNENTYYLKTDINSNAIHFVTNHTKEQFKTLLSTNYNNIPLKVLYGLNNIVFDKVNVPVFDIDTTKIINVCSNNNVCSSNIEVEYDE